MEGGDRSLTSIPPLALAQRCVAWAFLFGFGSAEGIIVDLAPALEVAPGDQRVLRAAALDEQRKSGSVQITDNCGPISASVFPSQYNRAGLLGLVLSQPVSRNPRRATSTHVPLHSVLPARRDLVWCPVRDRRNPTISLEGFVASPDSNIL